MNFELSMEHPAVALVPLALLLLTIQFAGAKTRLDRLRYFDLCIAGGAILMVAFLFAGELGGTSESIATVLLLLIYPIFQTAITVYRLQNCGWNKWLTLVMLIPVLNITFFLVLIFRAGRKPVLPADPEKIFD